MLNSFLFLILISVFQSKYLLTFSHYDCESDSKSLITTNVIVYVVVIVLLHTCHTLNYNDIYLHLLLNTYDWN